MFLVVHILCVSVDGYGLTKPIHPTPSFQSWRREEKRATIIQNKEKERTKSYLQPSVFHSFSKWIFGSLSITRTLETNSRSYRIEKIDSLHFSVWSIFLDSSFFSFSSSISFTIIQFIFISSSLNLHKKIQIDAILTEYMHKKTKSVFIFFLFARRHERDDESTYTAKGEKIKKDIK